jgi:hypothetical protein
MPRFLVLVLALAAAGLSACSNETLPPCPSVRVDSTTARLIKFGDGGGQTVNDLAYQAEVVAYQGVCEFSDDGVEVQMDLDFSILTGPAVKAGRESIYYFVAVPQLFPRPEGKRVFEIKQSLAGRAGVKERVRENNLRVFIPLKPNEPAASYDVYVGLQLTAEQLDYNRSQRTER